MHSRKLCIVACGWRCAARWGVLFSNPIYWKSLMLVLNLRKSGTLIKQYKTLEKYREMVDQGEVIGGGPLGVPKSVVKKGLKYHEKRIGYLVHHFLLFEIIQFSLLGSIVMISGHFNQPDRVDYPQNHRKAQKINPIRIIFLAFRVFLIKSSQ